MQLTRTSKIVFSVKTVCPLGLLIPFLGLLTPALAPRSHGYVFSVLKTKIVGGGAELALTNGIGLGGEVCTTIPSGGVTPGVGIASANAYYHFCLGNRVDPYLIGGYSKKIRGDSGSGGNIGFGVNLWLLRSLGFKIELRDHVISTNGTTYHWWGGRFGLNF